MNILFIRLGAIGDVIQAAAAISIFKTQYPQSSIDWIVDSAYYELVRSFKLADNVIAMNSSEFLSGGFLAKLLGLVKAQIKIRSKKQYDVVITAHPDWRYKFISAFIPSKKRISPLNIPGGFALEKNRSLEYCRLLNSITRANELHLPELNTKLVDEALFSLGKNILTTANLKESSLDLSKTLPRSFIALIPGGAKNILRDDPLRRWPIHYYVKLAKTLIESKKSVVLLGGPGDLWVSPEFKDLPVINLIGKTNLLDMIFILDQAGAVVCHDSGPLHLASITKAPLVTLFGPTPASAVISFTRPNTKILVPSPDITCSPCYDGKNYAPCNDNICMKSTRVESVLTQLDALLSSQSPE
jgi:heptosyltransferase-2